MTLFFNKNRQDDLEAIDELSSNAEYRIRQNFFERVQKLKSEKSLKIIRDYLESGQIDLALKYLESQEEDSYSLFFSVFLSAAILEIGLKTSALISFARKLNSIDVTNIPLNFDPLDPLSASIIRRILGQIELERKQTVRASNLELILQGQSEGLSPSQIASRIQIYSGLTLNQIRTVLNYENLLRSGNKEAARRLLRDPSFDPLLTRKGPLVLTNEQIQMMVAAYRNKMLNSHAEFLGRNLANKIINEARQEALKQVLNRMNLPQNFLVKEWRSVRDNRVRRTHNHSVGMDGQKVRGMEAHFVSPSGARLKHPHDSSAPISETAGCRCRMLIYLQQPE